MESIKHIVFWVFVFYIAWFGFLPADWKEQEAAEEARYEEMRKEAFHRLAVEIRAEEVKQNILHSNGYGQR